VLSSLYVRFERWELHWCVAACMRSIQELCANEWRPSRLEAECVQGDGLLLSFPAIECSPLVGHQLGNPTYFHVSLVFCCLLFAINLI